jgi:CheY-like chemotaxis protein
MNFQPQKPQPQPLRAVCVARHSFLTAHLARYFAALGVSTSEMVGLTNADDAVEQGAPDVVICDYDLLTTLPLHKWEQHPLLSRTPVVAVSLTRKSQELHFTEVDGIAGFLYLPTLEPEQALRILRGATSRPKYSLPMNAPTTTVERS